MSILRNVVLSGNFQFERIADPEVTKTEMLEWSDTMMVAEVWNV